MKRKDYKRFNSKKFVKKDTGESNILDYKSSAKYLNKIGMKKIRSIEISQMTNKLGWYYDITSILEDLVDKYNYIGWARVSVYGRPAITFYGLTK